MTSREFVAAVLAGSGTLKLAGADIDLYLHGIEHLLPELKARKAELLSLLHELGGWFAHFPACPQCLGYCLYRQGEVGLYECLRCGLQGIDENVARVRAFQVESELGESIRGGIRVRLMILVRYRTGYSKCADLLPRRIEKRDKENDESRRHLQPDAESGEGE